MLGDQQPEEQRYTHTHARARTHTHTPVGEEGGKKRREPNMFKYMHSFF